MLSGIIISMALLNLKIPWTRNILGSLKQSLQHFYFHNLAIYSWKILSYFYGKHYAFCGPFFERKLKDFRKSFQFLDCEALRVNSFTVHLSLMRISCNRTFQKYPVHKSSRTVSPLVSRTNQSKILSCNWSNTTCIGYHL